MTAPTLPLIAADIEGTGLPFYAAAWDSIADDETNVIWLAQPVLIEGHHWATEKQISRPHITLDTAAVAELLYAAEFLPVPIWTPVDDLDTAETAAVITAVLTWCRCDMAGIIDHLGQEFGDHPDVVATRMGRFRIAACRACGVSV